MSTIRKTFHVDGVLADMTSVLLSDPTGAYGLRRTDTLAVVVADGTPLTHVSTGVYEYTFVDPAADLEYEYYLEVVAAGDTAWFPFTFHGPTSVEVGPTASTMGVTYDDLVREVAFFLGFGRKASTELGAEDLSLVDSKVQAGYQQFLSPPKLQGDAVAHIWGFLSPTAVLTLVAGDWDYDLPENFGGMLGEFNYAANLGRAPVPQGGEGQVLASRSRADLSDYPRIAAIRPKASAGLAQQRFEVLVYPTPNGSYDWSYRYNVLMNKLTAANPYPLGGADHRNTLIESCLAAAETVNDAEGVHTAAFLRNLQASVSRDRQTASPKTLGYNADRSGDRVPLVPQRAVTVYGTLWGG
jgi:hypothetical protein